VEPTQDGVVNSAARYPRTIYEVCGERAATFGGVGSASPSVTLIATRYCWGSIVEVALQLAALIILCSHEALPRGPEIHQVVVS
jgi:hypothetical protein